MIHNIKNSNDINWNQLDGVQINFWGSTRVWSSFQNKAVCDINFLIKKTIENIKNEQVSSHVVLAQKTILLLIEKEEKFIQNKSILSRIFHAVRSFFGNFVFRRKAKLKMIQKAVECGLKENQNKALIENNSANPKKRSQVEYGSKKDQNEALTKNNSANQQEEFLQKKVVVEHDLHEKLNNNVFVEGFHSTFLSELKTNTTTQSFVKEIKEEPKDSGKSVKQRRRESQLFNF